MNDEDERVYGEELALNGECQGMPRGVGERRAETRVNSLHDLGKVTNERVVLCST